jgi:hypothetical protein
MRAQEKESQVEFQWNTDRLYQADGQRIKAIQLDDNSVIFADMSRGIDGHIKPAPCVLGNLAAMRDFVMAHYDRNDYQADETSWKFHMQTAKPFA